jgi:hypothetical protein
VVTGYGLEFDRCRLTANGPSTLRLDGWDLVVGGSTGGAGGAFDVIGNPVGEPAVVLRNGTIRESQGNEFYVTRGGSLLLGNVSYRYAGSIVDDESRLVQEALLRVVVVDEAGAPVPGVQVRASNADELLLRFSQETDAGGMAFFWLPQRAILNGERSTTPGDWIVEADLAGQSVSGNMSLGSGKPSAEMLVVLPNGPNATIPNYGFAAVLLVFVTGWLVARRSDSSAPGRGIAWIGGVGAGGRDGPTHRRKPRPLGNRPWFSPPFLYLGCLHPKDATKRISRGV